MKRLALISVSIIVVFNLIYPQDIINETGKDGKFIVRDAEQKEALVIEDGNIIIAGELSIDGLTQGSTEDRSVVWSPLDKKFKLGLNVLPGSPNASVNAADSWTESGSDVYRATGNVGIGVATPVYPLTVYRSGANASVVTQRNAGAINYMNAAATHGTFGTVNNFPTRISQNAQIKMFIDASNNGIYFGSTGNVTSSTDPDIDMSIDSDGNVGIGTNTPSQNFVVYDPTQTRIALQIDYSGTSSNDGLQIIHGQGTNGQSWILNNEDHHLHLGTNGSIDMTIENGGQIGIQTSAPTASLDVSGDVVLGENGSRFMEISEITGTTGGVGTQVISVAYPSGYNKSNTRILDYQVYTTANTWYGQKDNILYVLENGVIKLWYPNSTSYQSQPYRAILMRMP